ncbi:hypothetical protein [Motilibacter peucedani]|uniref:hypothetical protein n=1 Tax=Motilibacter peucedani TaxID=598650 RepID=UPI001E2D9FE3|nr:hypothetical protein [Motilibacter peucedani]
MNVPDELVELVESEDADADADADGAGSVAGVVAVLAVPGVAGARAAAWAPEELVLVW